MKGSETNLANLNWRRLQRLLEEDRNIAEG